MLKMGLRSLKRRKARTVLTVLGVVIGSLSIIIMISIGYGVNKNFETQVMQQGGLTTITVSTYGDIMDDSGKYVGSTQQKLDDNLVAQLKTLEHVRAVSPVLQADVALTCGRLQSNCTIMAMDMNSFDDFDFPELSYGQYPSAENDSVIVFGAQAPFEFYDPASRFSQSKKIDLTKQIAKLKFQNFQPDPNKKEFSLPLRNIAKMQTTNGEFDYFAYMDTKYFKRLYLQYCNTLKMEDRKKAIKTVMQYQQIKLNVDNIKNVIKVQDEIKKLGFQSQSQMQWLKPLQDASKTLQLVLLVLGCVSMVVSAINIANTMVMSIYERTKEIGIMKVLGCVVTDIRKLFLFEAGLIGAIGGVIGIILGYITSWAINNFGQKIFGSLISGGYPMGDMTKTSFSIIPLYLPLLALAISVCVGLISGYFPARRATKISAIEAMKTEG